MVVVIDLCDDDENVLEQGTVRGQRQQGLQQQEQQQQEQQQRIQEAWRAASRRQSVSKPSFSP
jgi:predicted TIM-barrel fold metal-dependent hydrolase